MFWLRYFEIMFRAGVAIIIKALGGDQLAIRFANDAWYKYELLRIDVRADRAKRRQRLVDTIAKIDAQPPESMSPTVRKAMERVRQLAVNFIADIDRRNAEEDT